MNSGLMLNMEPHILQSLREDISNEDISTASIIKSYVPGRVKVLAKAKGVLCGLDVFARVFQILDAKSYFDTLFQDGDEVDIGTEIGVVYGGVAELLSGERTALNYLQRMSGIATQTRQIVEMLKETRIQLADTRKTAPGLRIFDKYAVRMGKGRNHRYNLSDGIMLKDNHIQAAGGIQEAVALARQYVPFLNKIEVEVENIAMVDEAIRAGADVIMLDNMDHDQMEEAIAHINGRAIIEVSGNVTMDRINQLKDLQIDFISSGSLTHSVKAMDISMKHLERL